MLVWEFSPSPLVNFMADNPLFKQEIYGALKSVLTSQYQGAKIPTSRLTKEFFKEFFDNWNSLKKAKKLFGPRQAQAAVLLKDTLYFHTDQLGSTRLVTRADGTIYQYTNYLPFGKMLEGWVSSDPILPLPDYGYALWKNSYTGQEVDRTTGLYFYQSRFYDPDLGRFIQADTVVPSATDSQSFNRFSYVNNNPFKFTDPTGHWMDIGMSIDFASTFTDIASSFEGVFSSGSFLGGVGGFLTGVLAGLAFGGLLGMAIGGVVGAVAGGMAGHQVSAPAATSASPSNSPSSLAPVVIQAAQGDKSALSSIVTSSATGNTNLPKVGSDKPRGLFGGFRTIEQANNYIKTEWAAKHPDIARYLKEHNVGIELISRKEARLPVPYSNSFNSSGPYSIKIPFHRFLFTKGEINYDIQYELGNWIYKFDIRPSYFSDLNIPAIEHWVISHRIAYITSFEGMNVMNRINSEGFITSISNKALSPYDLYCISEYQKWNPREDALFQMTERGYK
ncbi:MAG: hypothetical protein A2V67_16610 [Deltaproteobacteria bacterium RBG_13_61_14]|nr:MAG: hypothetical protein A2V67_16610 [Deltaproteobacteria bacterium RBG_13_61_14]